MIRRPIVDGKLQCCRCREWKPTDEFNPKKGKKKSGYCKPCLREKCIEWRKANRGKYLRTYRAWVDRNREKINQKRRIEARRNATKINRLQRDRRSKNKRQYREYELRSKYGLTIVQYEQMVSDQRSRCACCGAKPRKLVVDHCHKLGAVRALLCSKCNAGIGFFDEDASKLEMAITYIKRHKR